MVGEILFYIINKYYNNTPKREIFQVLGPLLDEPLERLIRISTEGARLYKNLFVQLKLSGKRTGEKTLI